MKPAPPVMIRSLLLLSVLVPTLRAERIIPPANLFRDPQFIRDFVGSYGFLPDVEPKVNAQERLLLTEVSQLFQNSQFQEAEQAIVRHMQQVEEGRQDGGEGEPVEDISPALVFVLGNLYFQADRFDESRRAFLEAIRRHPRFRRAYTNLGYLYISKNQTREALPMLQKAIELGETTSRVFGLVGYCHLLGKDAVAAENAYRQAYLLDANSRDWKLGLAQALIAQEKFAESASLIGTMIAANENDKQLWLQQTNAYLAMENKVDAAVNLEILRLKGLADESNLNLLGNIYMDQNEPQLALIAYQAAMDKATEFKLERALKSARILNDYGHPDKADELLTRIAAKLGDEPSSEDRTAMLLTEVRVAQTQEDMARVSAALGKLLEINPADGEVLLENARHLSGLAMNEQDENKRQQLVQEARTNFQLALRNEEVAYGANLGLGQMHVRERRYTDALPVLEAALTLKRSESLEQYVSRVRRAADRQKQRLEREADQ